MKIGKLYYGWWVTIICFFIGLYVGGIVVYGFTAFFQPLVNEFGWSYAQVSFAASLRGMEMGLLAPLIGVLVDRFGSRKLIFLGSITGGFGLLLLSMTQSLPMFYASFALLCFGTGGCLSIVLISAVANWFHKNLAKAIGVAACGMGSGGLMIPIIVALIERYQWRTTLVIFGVGLWVLGIPLSLLVRNRPTSSTYVPEGEFPKEVESRPKEQGKGTEITFKQVFQNKSFLFLSVSEFLRMMSVYAVLTHVMPYLNSIGISRSTSGMVAAAISIFGVMGRLSFGWLGDLFSKKNMLMVGSAFTAVGMLAFCYANHAVFILAFLIIFPSGFGGSMVLVRALLKEFFGGSSFGRMLGLIMGIGAIGGIVGPTVAGWVFDTTRDYTLIWFIFFGLDLIAVLLLYGVVPQTKPEPVTQRTANV